MTLHPRRIWGTDAGSYPLTFPQVTTVSNMIQNGLEEHRKRARLGTIQSGNAVLDQLLGGGFQPGLVHLLYGARKVVARVLQDVAVRAQLAQVDGGLGATKIAYIDGENEFDPYALSYLAATLRLDPGRVLDNILLARAFNWDQIIENLAAQLDEVASVQVLVVAGLTTMIPKTLDRDTFRDLHRAIAGIKRLIKRCEPVVIISTRCHPNSNFRPLGGKILSHFASVLVHIQVADRRVEYTLLQHPARPPSRLVEWLPAPPKVRATQETTLDYFFTKNDALAGFSGREEENSGGNRPGHTHELRPGKESVIDQYAKKNYGFHPGKDR